MLAAAARQHSSPRSAVQTGLRGAGCSKGGTRQFLCTMRIACIKLFMASAAAWQLCMHTVVPSGESLQHCVAASMSTETENLAQRAASTTCTRSCGQDRSTASLDVVRALRRLSALCSAGDIHHQDSHARPFSGTGPVCDCHDCKCIGRLVAQSNFAWRRPRTISAWATTGLYSCVCTRPAKPRGPSCTAGHGALSCAV
jgi:hypothetical protein